MVILNQKFVQIVSVKKKSRNLMKILLKGIEFEDNHTLAGYESRGGYQRVKDAYKKDPLSLIEDVKSSGLRGRGGAGFPTGLKFSFIPRESEKPVYLIVNADESEPGTFKDRLILEQNPHLLIEGILCSAWALQATATFVYVRGEYAFPYAQFKKAVKECYEKGYLGKNIFGTEFSHDIIVHRGAGAYICGEEMALMESLEGRKGQPRLKPPFPAGAGLYGMPTNINNVETICNIPYIVEHGGEAYSKIGVENSAGTKLISASGHINNPGVYEVEMGYPLLDFINNECGGIRDGKKIKCVIPGGSSIPVLTGDELEGVNLDYDSLKNAGSSLGCAGFMVFDETTDMVEAMLSLTKFYAHESCGQCTPCREGGHWIEKITQRIADGDGRAEDPELIQSVCSQIGGHTICAFGDTMVLPYKSILTKFSSEFEARINKKDSSSILDSRA